MGARPGLDFIRRKWLHVIINDDFLEERERYYRALLPSIICLGRLRIASKYIFNLWQLRQRVDFLAQWLEHWLFNREDRVRFPGKTEYFFSYASFLCYGFHVVRQFVRDQLRDPEYDFPWGTDYDLIICEQIHYVWLFISYFYQNNKTKNKLKCFVSL